MACKAAVGNSLSSEIDDFLDFHDLLFLMIKDAGHVDRGVNAVATAGRTLSQWIGDAIQVPWAGNRPGLFRQTFGAAGICLFVAAHGSVFIIDYVYSDITCFLDTAHLTAQLM
jgi:hypothetical protein